MHSHNSLALTRVINLDKWEKRKLFAENAKKQASKKKPVKKETTTETKKEEPKKSKLE